MEFKSAREIEQIVWALRLSDFSRSSDRALINSLANGAPPYPDNDEIAVNVNDLSLTRLSHDARLQVYQAFNKPGNFFTCRTDMGPVSKRSRYGSQVTGFINKTMKRSDRYFECQRSKFALMVLHGIGPSNWENSDRWCGIPVGIEDVMIPSGTLLDFRNLPFLAIQRHYTPYEMITLTRRSNVDPGWNMPVVNRAIKWVDEQASKMYGGETWSEYWSPEKRGERIKEASGIYCSDLVPTIDAWDFYYWSDEGKHEGWRRRIIFDAWGGYAAWNGADGYGARNQMPDKNLLDSKNLFLYNSKDRVVASSLSEIVHFQFADLSAVAPFRYHSVRSLGFLLYAACHLQNRLRCALTESTFETLMNYLRVNSMDQAEKALKIDLYNRGIIDPSVQFLTQNERWNPNAQLAELGMSEIKQTIADNSSSYVQNQNLSRDRVEKTKFQVMAEVNAMQTLVSAGLQQAYRYQTSEYREIVRRFMKKDSIDPDVKRFRAYCLASGIPEKMLVPDAWDVEPERVVGGGNKTLEMAVSQQLMEWRAMFGPKAQQDILRMATLATTDDAALADQLVPESEGVSKSRQAAMWAFGSLMSGAEVQFSDEQNLLEVVTTLVGELALAVQKVMKSGGMASQDKIDGLQNVVQHNAHYIAQLAQDKTQGPVVSNLAKVNGKMANEVKGMAQRLAQQQKAAAAQNGNGNGELKSKIMANLITAKAKAANQRESHAQRTAERQLSFEQQQKQKAQDHEMSLQLKAREAAVNVASKDLETASAIRRNKLKATQAGSDKDA